LVGGTTASITMGQLTTGVQGVQLGAPATNSITAIIGSRTYTFTLTTVGYAPTTMFFMGDSVNASW